MNTIFVLSLLISIVFGRESSRFNFDYTKLKSISEASEFKDTVARFEPKEIGNRDGRIIDGQLARAGQFPHHILLVVDNTFWCGGSLIYQNWVLTVNTRC